MKRIALQWIVGSLLAIGVWQIGSAAYIHAKAVLAQELIADAWVRTLKGERHVRPWGWADAWPIARLKVPSSNVDLYVLSDATGRSLAFGPGLLSGTPLPGQPGNAVISAHRDTHFKFLRDVALNTEVLLQSTNGEWHPYRITQSFVLDVRTDRLAVESNRSTITLMTCYPFDTIIPGGPLRMAMIAEEEDVSARQLFLIRTQLNGR